MPVRFHNAGVRFSLKRRRGLKQFIERQLKKRAKRIQLDYIFCSDEFLLKINRQFLKHDFYTDVITFPLTSTKELLEAEIYISVEQVKENAAEMKEKLESEMLRVIFHGVLHLTGFNDKSKKDKQNMRREEDKWLNAYCLIK